MKTTFSFVTLLLLVSVAPAEVTLPALFSDNMVLQRDAKAPVWGKAAPGEKVTVAFGGQNVSATADKDGRWKLVLEPLKATAADGTGSDLTVTGTNTVVIKNVAVGEVWICSGQSNMEFAAGNAQNATVETAAANYPAIRMFTLEKTPKPRPADDCKGTWAVCTPLTEPLFSAVGYFFARDLHQRLNVPVGMINTSWGGTAAEPWTPMETLQSLDVYKTRIETYEKALAEYTANKDDFINHREEALKKAKDAREKWYLDQMDQDGGAKSKWMDPATDVADWKEAAVPMPHTPNVFNNYIGFVWMRKDVEVPQEWVGKELKLDLGPMDDVDITYVNGQKVGSMWYNEALTAWRTPRHYTIPASLVTGRKLVLVTRIMNYIGAIGMLGEEGHYSLRPAEGDAKPISLAGTWKYKLGSPIDRNTMPNLPVPGIPGEAVDISTLFNGMIAPLVSYGIRGAIWYQGESNAGDADGYRKLFPAMIAAWRKAWGQGEFPFYFVQLANFMQVQKQAIEPSSWADLRDSQTATLALPNTGMAVIIDIGEAADIHPHNKQDVSKRLALWAMAKDYGQKLEFSGPLYKSMKVEEGKVRVSFDHAATLAAKGGELAGFAVAGEDKVFHLAQARIDGSNVLVWSDKVPKPLAVRYAWANNPVCNLYNGDALPASPFRTDDWIIKDVKAAPDETVTTQPAGKP